MQTLKLQTADVKLWTGNVDCPVALPRLRTAEGFEATVQELKTLGATCNGSVPNNVFYTVPGMAGELTLFYPTPKQIRLFDKTPSTTPCQFCEAWKLCYKNKGERVTEDDCPYPSLHQEPDRLAIAA